MSAESKPPLRAASTTTGANSSPLPGELGLAWPEGRGPHLAIGFSDVQLTEQTVADYADTLAYLGAAIRCTAIPSAAWVWSAAEATATGRMVGRLVRTATSSRPGGPGERFKVACGCQPPRSFWIRAKQYSAGPITCGVCSQDFQP